MSVFSSIDVSSLPAPDVVETLDYETILTEVKERYKASNPDFTAFVESDPIVKFLEDVAYRELGLRQRVNDAARAVMLAYARGADLDNLAGNVPLTRRVETPGDPDARPVVPDVMESDDSFRARVQLAPEGFSTAGPEGAYQFHALEVQGVKDVATSSPTPGAVVVHVLGKEANGTPSPELLQAVTSKLTHEDVRPFTESVTIEAAGIVSYEISAVLHLASGPSPDAVLQAAQAAIEAYVSSVHVLGVGASLSGIYDALHVSGVRRVALSSPAGDVTVGASEAAYCTAINISTQVEA